MMRRDVNIVIVGSEMEPMQGLISGVNFEVSRTCPDWNCRFFVGPFFGKASERICALENVEVVHIVNGNDFTISECQNGSKLVSNAMKQKHPKAVASFSSRMLEEILRETFDGLGLTTFRGALQDAILYRWHHRPKAKLQLVS